MSVRRTDGPSWKIHVCSRNKWTLLENYKKVAPGKKEQIFSKNVSVAASDSLKSENKFSRRNVSTADVLHVHEVQESFKKCVFCLGNHAPSQCKGIVDVNSLMCLAKRFRLCFLCLGERHSVRQCKSSYKCKKCGGKHCLFVSKAVVIIHPIIITTAESQKAHHKGDIPKIRIPITWVSKMVFYCKLPFLKFLHLQQPLVSLILEFFLIVDPRGLIFQTNLESFLV